MKKDAERKKFYNAKMHERTHFMHAHLSKELKTKIGTKKRAVLINRGDSVKIMRGTHKGKIAKVAKVNYNKLAVYLEGISHKNAKGTEILIRFQPSNLMLTELKLSKERKKQFGISEQKEVQISEQKEVPEQTEQKQ